MLISRLAYLLFIFVFLAPRLDAGNVDDFCEDSFSDRLARKLASRKSHFKKSDDLASNARKDFEKNHPIHPKEYEFFKKYLNLLASGIYPDFDKSSLAYIFFNWKIEQYYQVFRVNFKIMGEEKNLTPLETIRTATNYLQDGLKKKDGFRKKVIQSHRIVIENLLIHYRLITDARVSHVAQALVNIFNKKPNDPETPKLEILLTLLETDLERIETDITKIEIMTLLFRNIPGYGSDPLRFHPTFDQWLRSETALTPINSKTIKFPWRNTNEQDNDKDARILLMGLATFPEHRENIKSLITQSDFNDFNLKTDIEEFIDILESDHTSKNILDKILAFNLKHTIHSAVSNMLMDLFYEKPLPSALIRGLRRECLAHKEPDMINSIRWIISTLCGDRLDTTHSLRGLNHKDSNIRSFAAMNLTNYAFKTSEPIKPTIALQNAKNFYFKVSQSKQLIPTVLSSLNLIDLPSVLLTNESIEPTHIPSIFGYYFANRDKYISKDLSSDTIANTKAWTEAEYELILAILKENNIENQWIGIYLLSRSKDLNIVDLRLIQKTILSINDAIMRKQLYGFLFHHHSIKKILSLIANDIQQSTLGDHEIDSQIELYFKLARNFIDYTKSDEINSEGAFALFSTLNSFSNLNISHIRKIIKSSVSFSDQYNLWEEAPVILPELNSHHLDIFYSLVFTSTKTANTGLRNPESKSLVTKLKESNFPWTNQIISKPQPISASSKIDHKANQPDTPPMEKELDPVESYFSKLAKYIKYRDENAIFELLESEPDIWMNLPYELLRSVLLLVETKSSSNISKVSIGKEIKKTDILAQLSLEQIDQLLRDQKAVLVTLGLESILIKLKKHSNSSSSAFNEVENLIELSAQALSHSFPEASKAAMNNLFELLESHDFKLPDSLFGLFASRLINTIFERSLDQNTLSFIIRWIVNAPFEHQEVLITRLFQEQRFSKEMIDNGSFQTILRTWHGYFFSKEDTNRIEFSVAALIFFHSYGYKIQNFHLFLGELEKFLKQQQASYISVLLEDVLCTSTDSSTITEDGILLMKPEHSISPNTTLNELFKIASEEEYRAQEKSLNLKSLDITDPQSLKLKESRNSNMERASIAAVVRYELARENIVWIVDRQHNLGYDILSFDVKTGIFRLIEVKGKFKDGKDVMISKHEFNTANRFKEDATSTYLLIICNIDALSERSPAKGIQIFEGIDGLIPELGSYEEEGNYVVIPRKKLEPFEVEEATNE